MPAPLPRHVDSLRPQPDPLVGQVKAARLSTLMAGPWCSVQSTGERNGEPLMDLLAGPSGGNQHPRGVPKKGVPEEGVPTRGVPDGGVPGGPTTDSLARPLAAALGLCRLSGNHWRKGRCGSRISSRFTSCTTVASTSTPSATWTTSVGLWLAKLREGVAVLLGLSARLCTRQFP